MVKQSAGIGWGSQNNTLKEIKSKGENLNHWKETE
jgi:hypothetical protein